MPRRDIDLVIESRAMELYEKRKILYNLAQVLRKANITHNVQVIAKAKVPIIKFATNLGMHDTLYSIVRPPDSESGRFAVDISLNQSGGIKTGRIIKGLLKELPALRSLVMMIKLFLNQRSMNEVYTGGLGSYAIVCMAVSFLQVCDLSSPSLDIPRLL